MRIKTAEAAVGKWYGILTALGVDESYLRNVHGPCPVCGGTDRFRFDDKEGRGTFYCTHCGPGDGMKLAQLITGLDFPEVAARIDGLVGNIEARSAPQQQQKDPRILLNRIRAGLKPADGDTPVRRYLERRGVLGDKFPAVKYHPSLEYWEKGAPGERPKLVGKFPAMVVPFIGIKGNPISYHITYLTEDGQKAPVSHPRKKMKATEPLEACALRLYGNHERIGVAEGIETALGANKKFGIPVWSLSDSGIMKKFIPPLFVKDVLIFGDNDANYEGQAAAYSLACTLSKRGIQVDVKIPERIGTDWADEV